MADTQNGEEATHPRNSDMVFLAECFKHLVSPANVDCAAVAKALEYQNEKSVANRLRALKKKLGIATPGATTNGNAEATPVVTSPKTPRKGAKAARGPIKAKLEPSSEGEEAKSPTTPAKRGRKPGTGAGRKRKTAPTEEASGTNGTNEKGDEEQTKAEKNAECPVASDDASKADEIA
ncbi:hypothetical protein FQN57_003320 [Myotisia sp. PD_48]|nr:hypothetical protein FQN57_003320 [Myotisia sp. PD_48]